MNSAPAASPSNTWLVFALLTVISWGVYGVILHKGRGYMPMGSETPHASLKAFLFVCIAYALIGGAAAILLQVRGSDWSFTADGVKWSLIAGTAGAVGAFTLVLALGVLGWALAREPWQLLLATLFSGAGWVTMAAAAVNAIVAPWFAVKRPAALA
ncbi:MAG: hypothetical protein WCP53_01330, partial [Verrucomicrobiota bacterium]